MKNKYSFLVKIGTLVFILSAMVIMPRISQAADAPTLDAVQTVANHTTNNDQTDVTTPTVANVPETKASRTIGVAALPGTSETITVGSCVVTFTTIASSTTDELNCNDNVASIDRTLSTGDTPRTTTQIATSLQSLTNASSTGTHGALTITSGGTATTTTFTTTGTETSATPITFTDGTGGDIVNISSTTGVVPVAQINTITIGGTVEAGDIFTATLPTVGAVNYTVTGGDTTTANIANGLKTAILASSGYAGQAFTAATSTNTVVLTAKVAGTGFTQTSSTTNAPGTAQVVKFTPGNVTEGDVFTATINSIDHSFIASDNSVQNAVEGLNSVLNDDVSELDCTEDDIAVTCTAATPGTPFTYDASATAKGTSTSGHHSGSGGGGGSSSSTPAPVVTPTPAPTQEGCLPGFGFSPLTGAKCSAVPSTTTTTTTTTSFTFTTDLTLGSTGADVVALQTILINGGYLVMPVGVSTGYFGALTQAALAKYQAANGISPAVGYFGPITRAALNK